ncbi:uncharacterized protein TNCV_2869051 [Trichonephila clavipes]|nr:uncharacterized protein TNCV_2869051 [Trichonephila clavipes]
MFSSIDRITAESRERFQQLQNLAQKYAFLRSEVISSMDELNLDQTPQDINKEEFQLEHSHAEIVVVEIGGVAIYRLFEEFRRAKSYCHLYGAQGQRQAYF